MSYDFRDEISRAEHYRRVFAASPPARLRTPPPPRTLWELSPAELDRLLESEAERVAAVYQRPLDETAYILAA